MAFIDKVALRRSLATPTCTKHTAARTFSSWRRKYRLGIKNTYSVPSRIRAPFRYIDTLAVAHSLPTLDSAGLSEIGDNSSLSSGGSANSSPQDRSFLYIKQHGREGKHTDLGIHSRACKSVRAPSEQSSVGNMVNQREPPRIPPEQQAPPQSTEALRPSQEPSISTSSEFRIPRPLQEVVNSQPQFGKTSPLRNTLKANDRNNPFVQQPPRHPSSTTAPYPAQTNKPFKQPQIIGAAESSISDVVEIPRPTNATLYDVAAAPRPMFSTIGPKTTFQAFDPRTYNPNTFEQYGSHARSFQQPSSTVDLTKESDGFNPDGGLNVDRDKFGAADPYMYVDASKANENIKALLEGAFEDEDDKPKIRLRSRRAKQVEKEAKTLSDKLEALQMKEGKTEGAEDDGAEDDGTLDGLSVKLLPHQVEGVAWMLDKEIGGKKRNGVLPKGGILADDMGLGKTIQSVALILTNPRPVAPNSPNAKTKPAVPLSASKCTLVVAPLALIKQWESEIDSKTLSTHKLKVLIHHGTSRTKRAKDLEKYDVVITTYQIVASEHAGSQMDTPDGIRVGTLGVHWYRVILDEAHTIKNRNAKSTKACYALRSVYRWCLTGTPMQNNLDELQSLICFLRIKPYHELGPWKQQITGPLKNGRGGLAMKRLGYFLKAFMKRRTKDILKKDGALNPGGKARDGQTETGSFKIVERKVEIVVADFTPPERAFYEKLHERTERRLQDMIDEDNKDYIGALVLLLRLRQACNHPELVGGNAAKDKDALVTGSEKGTQTLGKSKGSKDDNFDTDALADVLGGLSVSAKKCDVCQIELSQQHASTGAVRCEDCEVDLQSQRKLMKRQKKGKKSKKNQTRSKEDSTPQPTARRNKKVVMDSDDEEEPDADWVVPKSEQRLPDLGKAGGSDDENAEGEGESLHSEDSETDEEDPEETDKSRPSKKAMNLVSSDAGSSTSELSSDEDEDEDNEDSSDEDAVDEPMISAKIRYLLQILEKETPGHKVIVFSQFTSMLDLIEPFLTNAGYVFTRYDGSMRNDLREASLDKLRNDKRTRVLLCSLKCGSLGLNLTAASRVVILEPFWNPFVEEQAIDRVHRLNQTVDVHIYRLTIASTVEERILALQEKKRELANAAIEGGKAVAKLSMKDIMNLFSHDAEHRPEHSSADDKNLGFGRTPGVLGSARKEVVKHDMDDIFSGGLRGKGPKKAKGSNDKSEHEVFGRRW
ncbi:MAG: hypothetical protein M1820_008846 [Bogoriella megaspora]|nr:MAG: hypothetical protein M1820_008846 [Bogoriella megaspora]